MRGHLPIGVAEAASGEALLDRTDLTQSGLLITDLNLAAGVNAATLARALRQRWPPLRTLCICRNPLPCAASQTADECGRLLAQPFTADALIDAVFQLARNCGADA